LLEKREREEKREVKREERDGMCLETIYKERKMT